MLSGCMFAVWEGMMVCTTVLYSSIFRDFVCACLRTEFENETREFILIIDYRFSLKWNCNIREHLRYNS